MQDNDKKKKVTRKPSRTLLLKEKNSSDNTSWFDKLPGLLNHSKTDNTGSHFLTFDNIENSQNALKVLKTDHDDKFMGKYAHYKIFFTMTNLDKDSDYNQIKENHIKFVENNAKGNVLYYKLYRNNGFLGCGDLTVDTKDTLDLLLSQDKFKEFDIGNGNTGIFYKYNRRDKNNMNEMNAEN